MCILRSCVGGDLLVRPLVTEEVPAPRLRQRVCLFSWSIGVSGCGVFPRRRNRHGYGSLLGAVLDCFCPIRLAGPMVPIRAGMGFWTDLLGNLDGNRNR